MGRHIDEAWNVECEKHGLLPTARNRDSCAAVVAEHWLLMHDGVGAAIQGRDWVAYPALQRCDTCTVPIELPAWSHTATGGPLGMEEMMDVDGQWLLCDLCHGFFTARKLGAWVRHWLEVSRTLGHYPQNRKLDTALRSDIAQRFRVLLDSLDAGVRFPW